MSRARRQLRKAGHRNAPGPIHDTRKTIKKLRAGLRLASELAEQERVEAVAGPLREAAHRLGPLRDAQVLSTTAQSLRKPGEKRLAATPAPPARRLLHEARAELQRAQTGLDSLLKLEFAPYKARHGLERLYRRARRAWKRARREASDENLHAWRRRAKDLFYNLELLSAPEHETKKVKQLTELLGDDHDLAFLAAHHGSPAERKAHRPLFRHLAASRARLQKKAFRLGAAIFRKPPKKWAL